MNLNETSDRLLDSPGNISIFADCKVYWVATLEVDQ